MERCYVYEKEFTMTFEEYYELYKKAMQDTKYGCFGLSALHYQSPQWFLVADKKYWKERK